jgi:hypothetical protein
VPLREGLRSVLVVGSGPIVIGQAAEFDYSGTQACRALRRLGLRVVLVNSNPATIMTDPEVADATYLEPLTAGPVAAVLEAERPDALLPTLGGQTALNLAVELHEHGTLERLGVELVGATRASPRVQVGASPRGTLALLKVSRAKAAMAGRDFVTPEDVKAVAVPALAHRLILRPELWVRRVRTEDVVAELLGQVPTPPPEAEPLRAGQTRAPR